MLSFLSPFVDELLQELEKERCAKIEAERKLKGKIGAWDALFFFFFFFLFLVERLYFSSFDIISKVSFQKDLT